jgi:hypothetical protein
MSGLEDMEIQCSAFLVRDKVILSRVSRSAIPHDRAIPYENRYTLLQVPSMPDNPTYIHKLAVILQNCCD